MFPDFKDLIALLNKHEVKYLVVGGYAVARHAQPRATKDLDILIQTTPKNAAAVYAALAEFGAPLRTRAGPADDPHVPMRKLTAKDFEDRELGTRWVCRPLPSTFCPRSPASTRQNSSHLGISYAVFCLKKK